MRPRIQTTMMDIAKVLARRATCRKLRVGAVLVDDDYKILATGYNGVPQGMTHCVDTPCPGVHAPKGADLCEAVHAEQNALMQCRDVGKIRTIFVTHAPCMRCTKMLLNTECWCIFFADDTQEEPNARDLWRKAGRVWAHYVDVEQ